MENLAPVDSAKDVATKEYVDASAGTGGGVEEVAVSATEPTDPNIKYWIDPSGTPPAGGGGGGHTVMDEGVALPQRANLDFVGPSVTVTDDAAGGRTVVTVLGVKSTVSQTAPANPQIGDLWFKKV
jgi:hypothetical protein